MTPPPWLAQAPPVLLGVFCLGCVVTDLREHKIYNPWSFGFLGLGLLLGGVLGGGAGLGSSLAGAALGFAVLFPLFAAGGIGAGDAKMLMAIGALMGWRFLASVCLWGGLAGAVMSFGVLAWDARRLGGVVAYLALMQKEIKDKVSRAESVRTKMPYGVAIAAGALAAWFHPLLAP